MSLLSAALRSQSCTSLGNSAGNSSSASASTTLPHSISTSVLLGSPSEHSVPGSADLNDDSGAFLVPVVARTPTDEELLFGADDVDGSAQMLPSRAVYSVSNASMQLRPLAGAYASDTGVAIPMRGHYPGGQQAAVSHGPPVARSCPRPILMPRRAPTQQQLLDDQEEFVPPHEIVASSLMDPSNVAESLCRKGSHMLRMRSSLLRSTGFLEGKFTETSVRQGLAE